MKKANIFIKNIPFEIIIWDFYKILLIHLLNGRKKALTLIKIPAALIVFQLSCFWLISQSARNLNVFCLRVWSSANEFWFHLDFIIIYFKKILILL